MLGFLNLLHGTMDLKHFYRCIQLSVDSLMRPAFQHNLAFTFIEEDSEQYRRHIVIVQSSIASQVAHAFSFLIQLNGYCFKVNINCRQFFQTPMKVRDPIIIKLLLMACHVLGVFYTGSAVFRILQLTLSLPPRDQVGAYSMSLILSDGVVSVI